VAKSFTAPADYHTWFVEQGVAPFKCLAGSI
jgi:hypothetical protein